MARRKQKHSMEWQTTLGLAALGALWLLTSAQGNNPNGAGYLIGLIVLIVIAGVVAYLLIRLYLRMGACRSLLAKVRIETDQKLEQLLRRRAQLVRLDPYGKPQTDRWVKEIDYFIKSHIQPSLERRECAVLKREYQEVAWLVSSRVEAAMRDQPALKTFSNDMTPVEFETFCAEELRRAGWNVRVTMQSRDQGVDVIAVKNGCRVVLQCKLYTRPVGNKSVQEVTAGRAHEQAEFGIVVSNNRYTAAAEQLAATNHILLLHYRDLRNLEDILIMSRKTSCGGGRG